MVIKTKKPILIRTLLIFLIPILAINVYAQSLQLEKPQPNYFGLFIFYSIQILLFICGIIFFILARKTPSKMLKTATLLPLIGILFLWIGRLIVKIIPPYPDQPDLYMQFVAFSPILLGTISVILSILSFIKTEKKLLVLSNLIYTIIYSLLAFYLLVVAVRPQ